jgi:integrase
MGYLKVRKGRDGKSRYTACYLDLQGSLRSAGTFATKKEANDAWRNAEVRLAEGRAGDPRRGRQRFQHYVEQQWLPHHVMELTTREGYTYQINKHILPWFGPMRMIDILPSHVREWITRLQHEGVSPATIESVKNILSAIFTTALNDQVVFIHACKGVKTPTVPTKPLTIITPEQFDTLYGKLPDADAQLLVETEIETGLRWGELTELRPKDLDITAHVFTISRAVVQVNPKFHPDGKRFFVKEYPKDKEWRRVKVSEQLAKKIDAHIRAELVNEDDLLFSSRAELTSKPRLRTVPNPEALGLTDPNPTGSRYHHGTLSGYNAGKCRCRHCKDSFAIYRATRRAKGKDAPRAPRVVDTDSHISRDWFRNQVWAPARNAAGLTFNMRVHDLRHAHASWLLAGGADLQVVKERLGHGSITTTERYLHTLPDTDDTAVNAFNTIRYRTTKNH